MRAETMKRRVWVGLGGAAMLCGGWGAVPAMAVAQQDGSVHPITSLPRPPGYVEPENAAVAVPAAAAVPAQAVVPAAPPVQAVPVNTTGTGTQVGAGMQGGAGMQAYPAPPAKDGQGAGYAAPDAVPTGPVPLSYAKPQPEHRVRGTEDYITRDSISAFSTIAVQFKVTTSGFGMDLATPLFRRLNARVGASLFSYSASYNVDGTTINGEAKLRSVNLSLDWFPFNNGFRVSPGVNVYNGNNMNAAAFVGPGVSFDLGPDTFYSSLTDPIHGSASATFGHRVAPTITMGFGNMIPRSGKHVTFPFEVGVEFLIQQPMVNLYLQGTACVDDPNSATFDPTLCGPVSILAPDVQLEQDDVNNQIRFLRFYPILSQGIAFRF